jgi:cytochrome c oxidase subunit 2
MRRLVLLSPMFLLPLGCERVQSTLYPAGPAAHRIATVSWFMIILFLAVIAIMWTLIAIAVTKGKGTLEEHAPVEIGGGHGWVALGGLIIPGLILFMLFVIGLRLLASFPIHSHGDANLRPEILITGHQWWWEVQYLNDDASKQAITANEIHIPAGRPVTIELKSADVIHSFWVPALHGKVDLIPGHPNFVRVEAAQPGVYHGTCAEYCGAQHAHMRLLVIAQPADEYKAWLEGQRKPAQEPTSPEAQMGEQVFLTGPCSLCHSIRGTIAGGRVAPDLTHIASREYIAANSYRNNNANLEAWVTHAQSMKPEAQMPNLPDFDGQHLRALVAYLRQLQ